MSGYIRQRSKGTWEITVDTGRDANGRRMRHFETVTGTRKAAQIRLAELLIEINNNSYIRTPATLTIGDYLKDWLRTHAEQHCSPRTYEGYESIVRCHLFPGLGKLRLNELRPLHISLYCSEKLTQGLSRQTVRHHYRALHKAMADAVRLQLINVNPCTAVQAPKPVNKEMSTLQPSELGCFLSAAKSAPWPFYYLFYTDLYTGMRRSEILGLVWDDVDLELCTITVKQSLIRTKKGGFFLKPPKTNRGRRQIDIPPSLAVVLRQYKNEVQAQRLLVDTTLKGKDFVFAHYDGSPFCPSVVTHAFIKLARKAGLSHLRLHDLRHSYASLMLAAKVDIKAISQALGHASIGITLDTYAHLLPGAGKAAAESLDKLLQPYLP